MTDLTAMDIADIRYFSERTLRERGVDVVGGDDDRLLDSAGVNYDLVKVRSLCVDREPHEWADLVKAHFSDIQPPAAAVVNADRPSDDPPPALIELVEKTLRTMGFDGIERDEMVVRAGGNRAFSLTNVTRYCAQLRQEEWQRAVRAHIERIERYREYLDLVTPLADLSWNELTQWVRSGIETELGLSAIADCIHEASYIRGQQVLPGADTFEYALAPAPGLFEILYLDCSGSIVPLPDSAVRYDRLGEVREAARRNTAIDSITVHPASPGIDFQIVSGESVFTAAKVVDVASFAPIAGLDPERPIVFALPDRSRLLCHQLSDPESALAAFDSMCAASAELYERGGRLTPNLYIWDSGRLDVLAIVGEAEDGGIEYLANRSTGLGELVGNILREDLDSFQLYLLETDEVIQLIRSRVISERQWRQAQQMGLPRDYGWPVIDGLVEVLAFVTDNGDVPVVDGMVAEEHLEGLRTVGRRNSAAESEEDIQLVDIGVDVAYSVFNGLSLADRVSNIRDLLMDLQGDLEPALITCQYRDLISVHRYVDDQTLDSVVPVLLRNAIPNALEPVPLSPDVFLWDGEHLTRFAYLDSKGDDVWIAHDRIGQRSRRRGGSFNSTQ